MTLEERFRSRPTRLQELRNFYNLTTEEDVIELGLRVLEMGYQAGSPIYYSEGDEFYEIIIG